MIAAIIARGDGATAAAAGFVQRAFASAEVEAPDMIARALTPACLGMIGWALIRSGELRLWPCESWDVSGNYRDWRYRLTCGGPSRTRTFKSVESTSTLHFRYAVDPSRPWRGLSPLAVASLAGRLSAETQYQPRRFGADPPDAVISQAKLASAEVYAACGLSPALFTTEGETAQREAYRQALHSLVAPLGKLVSAELEAKLAGGVKLDWRELRAGDISGRARAFQSLVGGAVRPDDAGRKKVR